MDCDLPPEALLRELRIAQLHRHPVESPGWWLRFRSSADRDVFAAGQDVIRALPRAHRQWMPGEKMWWVSDQGVTCLRALVPALATVLNRIGFPYEPATGYAWHERWKSAGYDDGYGGARDTVIHVASCRYAGNPLWEVDWTSAATLGQALIEVNEHRSGPGRVRFCRVCLPSGRSMKRPLIYTTVRETLT